MSTDPTPTPAKPRRQDRRAEIESLIALRKRDGLTWRQLSARSGIPVGTLTTWQQKLRKESAQRATRFVEVAAPPPAADFTLETAAGLRIVVPTDFDPASLTRLLTALGVAC